MVGAVTAAVAAVASVGIAAYGMVQQGNVASQQQQAENSQLGIQQQQLQMEQGIYNQQQPYRVQLNSLIQSPGQIVNDPGYQFFKNQGAESVARQFAANPGGSEGVALANYGTQYAEGAYQQQVQLLSSLSGLTQGGASYGPNANPAGTGGNAVTSQNNSFSQMQQLLSQGGALAKMFGPSGSFSSAGTPGAGGSVSDYGQFSGG